MDVRTFFTKWLNDLRVDQYEDGGVPYVIPDLHLPQAFFRHSSTAWGDAAVNCPWTIYKYYGDKKILESQYDSMLRMA